jgi:EpsI family protein
VSRNYHFWLKVVIMLGLVIATEAALTRRGSAETIVPHRQLSAMALNLGEWNGHDLALEPDVLEVLGPGDFLLRTYVGTSREAIPVQAFIAYFPSQRVGDTMHSPRNCLPGSGWEPVEASYVNLQTPLRKNANVNRFIVQNGSDRQLVLYWYQAHGRIVASEYWGKYFLIRDAIRMNRSDGALIRITTPIVQAEGAANAEKRAIALAETLLSELTDYIPN